MKDNAYTDIFDGKRVVLVGPSRSILETAGGEWIDSFDVVVRINNQWPIREDLRASLGSRMDVLYHCCNADFPISRFFIPKFKNTKLVCHERGFDTFFLKRFCTDSNIPTLDVTSVYGELSRAIGTYPNTGMVAIYHLLKFSIRELYITGFTFFKEPYYEGYLGATAAPEVFAKLQETGKHWGHAIAPQFEYFKTLSHTDQRISVDETLRNLLSGAGI